jgi:cell division protein ZapE
MPMKPTPAQRYSELVANGTIAPDPAQARLAERLSSLSIEVGRWADTHRRPLLGRLLRRGRPVPPRGLYVHGDVGRGKTMLVDLFFDTAPLAAKQRAHFNDFMADVHERIHVVRTRFKAGESRNSDPIPPVAADIARGASLLCLDELHVDDIADAMILGRLFTALFGHGVVAVATSNSPPDDLYAHGLNRDLFLPFVRLLKERMEIMRLDADTDYRLDKLRGSTTWFAPLDSTTEAGMAEVWKRLTGADAGEPKVLSVKGRSLHVPQAHMGVARLGFADLCQAALGPNDFLALARSFHTIMIDHIPIITPRQRNEARRFVLLIDTLYDYRVKLIASAAAQPDALYPDGPLEGEFRRTVSRLIEMQSEGYMSEPHGSRSTASSPTQDAVTQSTTVP